jgi:histidinol-phosphate aminotransferase
MFARVCNLKRYLHKNQEDHAKMGVMIRHYDKKELKGYIRILVGKPEHNDVLTKGLNALQL